MIVIHLISTALSSLASLFTSISTQEDTWFLENALIASTHRHFTRTVLFQAPSGSVVAIRHTMPYLSRRVVLHLNADPFIVSSRRTFVFVFLFSSFAYLIVIRIL